MSRGVFRTRWLYTQLYRRPFRFPVGPTIVEDSITFATIVDKQSAIEGEIEATISFDTIVDESYASQLTAEADITFSVNLDEETVGEVPGAAGIIPIYRYRSTGYMVRDVYRRYFIPTYRRSIRLAGSATIEGVISFDITTDEQSSIQLAAETAAIFSVNLNEEFAIDGITEGIISFDITADKQIVGAIVGAPTSSLVISRLNTIKYKYILTR